MAKLLKHLGIGVKKTPSTSSSTPPSSGPTPSSSSQYNSTQKSTSVQELLPKSPTRYRSSGSLSTNVNHDFDTQSLKSFFDGQQRSTVLHGDQRGAAAPGGGSQHGGSGSTAQHRHRGGGGDPGSMSPKGGVGGSDGHYPAAYGTSVMSVTEEGEVFDSSPGTSSAQSTETSTNHMATPSLVLMRIYDTGVHRLDVGKEKERRRSIQIMQEIIENHMPRLTDEYCDPVDLRNQLAESADLLGACAPAPTIEDDYSVPYEVKKIVKDVKLTNWHGANGIASHITGEQRTGFSPHLTSIVGSVSGGDGTSFDDSFDEPWEWTAKMNNLAQNSLLYGSKNNKCTPLMTPKKTVNGHGETTIAVAKADEMESTAKPSVVDRVVTDRSCVDETVEDKENVVKEGGLVRDVAKNIVEGKLDTEVKNNDGKGISPPLDSISSAEVHEGKDVQASDGAEVAIDDAAAAAASQSNLLSRISAVDRPNKLGSGGSLIVSTVIGGVDTYECYTSSPSGVMTQQKKLVVNPLLSPGSSVVSPTECSPLTSPSAIVAEISPVSGGAPQKKSQHNPKCVARDDGSITENNLQATQTGSVESSSSVGGVGGAACKKCDQGKQSSSRKHKSSKGSTRSSGSELTNIASAPAAAAAVATSSALKIDTDLAVEQQCWYHGSVGRTVAEDLLRSHKEGSFLVRQSESNKQDYSLSLKSAQGFLHMKIVNHDGKFILGQFSQPFETIPLMIDFYCTSKLPIKGNEHICLVHPLDSDLL